MIKLETKRAFCRRAEQGRPRGVRSLPAPPAGKRVTLQFRFLIKRATAALGDDPEFPLDVEGRIYFHLAFR